MTDVARLGPRLLAAVRGRDLAVSYAGVVIVVAIALSLVPSRVADRFILDSSTNLVNLRQHPPFVLVVSAFVEPAVWHVWIVVPLVWAYGTLQRWLGRGAVLITVVLGHVGTTLFVATVLTAGMVHGRIALAEDRATDVGVSYGLVTVMGLLSLRVPPRWQGWYLAGISLGLVGQLLIVRSFTDLGHLVAWILGLGLALLVGRAQLAIRPSS